MSQPRPTRVAPWKLNTSILEDEEYKFGIQQFVSNAVKVPLRTLNVSQWWDLIFKPGVKDVTIDYCRRRAQLTKDTKMFYESCLRELVAEEGRLQTGPPSRS